MMIEKILIIISIAGASSNPVVVPGPICAVEDCNAAAPSDNTILDESAYFENSCVVSISGDMLFDFNSYKIKPDAIKLLEDWKQRILSSSAKFFYIDGHTDAVGSDSYNFKLSLKRAESVQSELVRLGVSAERIRIRGFGESKPAASNQTEEGRAKNRRVELVPSEEK